MPDHWKKKFKAIEWYSRARGHGQGVPNFQFDAGECLGFFVEFLGCVLIGDCV